MDFSISNHPYTPSITRTVSLSSMIINIAGKTITLGLIVEHYLDGVKVPELTKTILSVANNNHTFTHPTAGEIGEFDYWMLLYEAGTPLSAMLAGGIANIDALGVINNKCQYQNAPEPTTTTTEYIEETTTTLYPEE